jgi:hypothetical protein
MSRATIARSPTKLVEVRPEMRWAILGRIGFWFGVAFLLAVPVLLGLLVVTKYLGSIPRFVAEDHLLSGELPIGFPTPLVRDETSALSRSFDYASFQACTLSDPRQVQEIRTWLSENGASPAASEELENWLRSSPAWFREKTLGCAIEWWKLETKTGRSLPDSLFVGLDEQHTKLFVSVSKP